MISERVSGLVSELARWSRFGGKDGRSTTKTLIAYLLPDKLCVLYTWKGTVIKIRFSALHAVVDTMLASVRKKYGNYTKAELIKWCKLTENMQVSVSNVKKRTRRYSKLTEKLYLASLHDLNDKYKTLSADHQ